MESLRRNLRTNKFLRREIVKQSHSKPSDIEVRTLGEEIFPRTLSHFSSDDAACFDSVARFHQEEEETSCYYSVTRVSVFSSNTVALVVFVRVPMFAYVIPSVFLEDDTESDVEEMALEFFSGLHDYIQCQYMDVEEIESGESM